MKRIFSLLFCLFFSPAFADDWVVIETTRTYQIKITQPSEKYEDYLIVWQKLLLYNRSWYVAKVLWDCKNRSFKTLVSIAGYSDEPPAVDYGVIDSFHQVTPGDINEPIYKRVCFLSSTE